MLQIIKFTTKTGLPEVYTGSFGIDFRFWRFLLKGGVSSGVNLFAGTTELHRLVV